MSVLYSIKEPLFNGVTISFQWNYHNQPTRSYEVTWIGAFMESPKAYPKKLQKLLKDKQIDFYYQKASLKVPQIYHKFLPAIAQGIKEGGYLLTCDYDNREQFHLPEPDLKSSKMDFQLVEETPMIQGFKKLFVGQLGSRWVTDAKDFAPPGPNYWSFVTLRQKAVSK